MYMTVAPIKTYSVAQVWIHNDILIVVYNINKWRKTNNTKNLGP